GLHWHPTGCGLLHGQSTGAQRGHAQPLGTLGNRAGAQLGRIDTRLRHFAADGKPTWSATLHPDTRPLEQNPVMSTSPIWMVGDLQGCNDALLRLLDHPDIAADPDARFWFAGDLINRGPQSLQTLRTIMSLGERAICVLGNHDIHMLAVAEGIRKPGKS